MKVPGSGAYSQNRRDKFTHTKAVYRGDVLAAVVAKEVYDLLNAAFKTSGFTQQELADQMQRSQSYVSGYLLRKKRVLALPSLAELFYHLGYKLDIQLIPITKYLESKQNSLD